MANHIQSDISDIVSIFRATPTPFLVLDPDFLIYAANDAYLRATSRTLEHIVGQHIFEAFPDNPDDPNPTGVASVKASLERVVKTKKPDRMPILKYDIPVPNSVSGEFEERYWSPIHWPVFSESGELKFIIQNAEDVTATVLAESKATRAAHQVSEEMMARKRAEDSERSLRETQEYLTLALRAGRMATWQVDLKTHLLTRSLEWYEIFGFHAPVANVFEIIDTIVHPEDKIEVNKAWLEAVQKRIPFQKEYRILHPDGGVRWIHVSGETKLNEAGEPSVFAGLVSDVTERKQALLELERSRRDLYDFVMQSPAPMMILLGAEHRFAEANPAYERLVGRKVVGKTVAEAFSAEEFGRFIPLLDRVYQTGKPYIGKELPLNIPDENRIIRNHFINFGYYAFRDTDGQVKGILADFQDVTEQVLARKAVEESERRLEASQARLESALRNGKMGLWEIQFPEGILYTDEIFRRFHHTLKTENIDQAIDRNAHPDDRALIKAALADSMEKGVPYDCQYRIIDDKGSPAWVAARGEPRFNEQGKIVSMSGVAFQIEEQKQIEFALEKSRLEAERANEAKSAFLANMSHEIRSPLGAIMGFTELLQNSDLTGADHTEYLGIIERNSHQLLRVIDDILDLAKVEAGKINIERIDFTLPNLLADFASLMGFKARENGIAFHLSADTPLPETIQSDPVRIRQILNNVVGNAIKFTASGSVKLKVSYQNGVLTFEVTDTGRGISDEQAGNLFKPFTQADASTTRKFGGTGLGLVLTRGLCRIFGGEFSLLRSDLGVGSTFRATLNVGIPPHSSLIQPHEVNFKAKPPRRAVDEQKKLSGLRILLVEDSPDNQVLVKTMAQTLGADITIASDGVEGVEQALSEEFDIILMDVQMPRKDGHTAVQELRSAGYKQPIIALTAHAMKDEIDRTRASGFTDFISKPIEREALTIAILSLTQTPGASPVP